MVGRGGKGRVTATTSSPCASSARRSLHLEALSKPSVTTMTRSRASVPMAWTSRACFSTIASKESTSAVHLPGAGTSHSPLDSGAMHLIADTVSRITPCRLSIEPDLSMRMTVLPLPSGCR